AAAARAADPARAWGRVPLRFEANRGQADSAVRFVARQGRDSVLLTREGLAIASQGSLIRLRPDGGRAVDPVGERPLASRSRYYLAQAAVEAPHVGRVRYAEVYPGV